MTEKAEEFTGADEESLNELLPEFIVWFDVERANGDGQGGDVFWVERPGVPALNRRVAELAWSIDEHYDAAFFVLTERVHAPDARSAAEAFSKLVGVIESGTPAAELGDDVVWVVDQAGDCTVWHVAHRWETVTTPANPARIAKGGNEP